MTPTQLETRIQELLDGALAEEHWDSLVHILRTSEEARQLYCHYAKIHTLLREHSRGIQSLANSENSILPIKEIATYQRKKTIKTFVFSFAALITISLITLWFIRTPTSVPPITFKESAGSKYTLTHSSEVDSEQGDKLLQKGSTLSLSYGTLELTFSSGVRSILQAPAEITLLENDELMLSKGIAWFHVPEEAIGFQVRTHEILVTDLGTEFGVISTGNAHDEVHLLKGKVKVQSLTASKNSETLSKREARIASASGKIKTTKLAPEKFLTELPQGLPYMHWSFDEPSGNGFEPQGSHPLLSDGFARGMNLKVKDIHTDGKFGKAVRFSGTPDQGLLTSWYGISGNNARTVTCWIKIEKGVKHMHEAGIVAWGLNNRYTRGENTKWLLSCSKGGRPIATGYHGYKQSTRGGLNDGKWHHLAFVHDQGENNEPIVTIFIDGKEVATEWKVTIGDKVKHSNIITNSDQSDPVIFGTDLYTKNQGHHTSFNGTLDEVYIFEGVLSPEQIAHLAKYNRLSP